MGVLALRRVRVCASVSHIQNVAQACRQRPHTVLGVRARTCEGYL